MGEPTSVFRATVAYDGAAFHGFQANPQVSTVGGTLQQALEKILDRPTEITCAGRTDRGVHARGQVISFNGPNSVDPVRLRRSLNRLCEPFIVVSDITVAPDDFDARFSAVGRTYRYQVLNRGVPDPFLHRTTWHIADPLDLDAMNEAGRHVVGEHDFTSFCRRRMVTVNGQEIEATLMRRVLSVAWEHGPDDLVELWISATAFCHQMVRALTGQMAMIGLGKGRPEDMARVLAAKDRSVAATLAPPHALTLWRVHYPDA